MEREETEQPGAPHIRLHSLRSSSVEREEEELSTPHIRLHSLRSSSVEREEVRS